LTTCTPPPDLPADAALFLDFDGTLVPLARRPDEVVVPAWVAPTLSELRRVTGGALAIVSGRPIAQIDHFLRPLEFAVAGAHGAEHRTASGQTTVQRLEPPDLVVTCARRLAAEHADLLLEAKASGLALHYRACPELAPLCFAVLQAALDDAARTAALSGEPAAWELLRGHCVFEVKQRDVSKGLAMQTFLREPCFFGRLPVFIGDDLTDEDGFVAAQVGGGFGIRVGPVGPTRARHRLADTDAVALWLGRAAAQRTNSASKGVALAAQHP
jgi:trehalose 6-phosphate phosphatase